MNLLRSRLSFPILSASSAGCTYVHRTTSSLPLPRGMKDLICQAFGTDQMKLFSLLSHLQRVWGEELCGWSVQGEFGWYCNGCFNIWEMVLPPLSLRVESSKESKQLFHQSKPPSLSCKGLWISSEPSAMAGWGLWEKTQQTTNRLPLKKRESNHKSLWKDFVIEL